jgi:hypothetical protein
MTWRSTLAFLSSARWSAWWLATDKSAANATGVGADGIKHNFATRQFTPLGNYREFLTRQIAVEGASKIAAAQKAKAASGKATAEQGERGS